MGHNELWKLLQQALVCTPLSPPPHTHTQPYDSAVTSLQEQIEREYKIREGAAKLLQASKNSRQSMEASKGLFVSNAKIIALMKELQQRQGEGGGKRSNRCVWLAHRLYEWFTMMSFASSDDLQPCNAKIAISGTTVWSNCCWVCNCIKITLSCTEIRIPLEWREFESTKGKTGTKIIWNIMWLCSHMVKSSDLALSPSPSDPHARHGVFCLFKVGNQVMDTPSLVEVDRNTMDIIFRDSIILWVRDKKLKPSWIIICLSSPMPVPRR